MTQITTHPRGGWRQDEIDLLFSAVQSAADSGRPLRDVFADVGAQLSRKPNSIRNFYYARVRERPELCARQAPFRAFTPEEVHHLLRQVLISRGQGQSVRACVTRLADGDRAGMLRYQNKYRSVLKNRPEMLVEVAQELRAEGLPCPEDAAACRRYSRSGKAQDVLTGLEPHLRDPDVRALLEDLLQVLTARPSAAQLQRENDRLKVEADLLRMALEDAREAR